MSFIPYSLDVLGTTDILEKGTDNVVFITCPEERNQVVFQMGTSNAMRALKAAEIVYLHFHLNQRTSLEPSTAPNDFEILQRHPFLRPTNSRRTRSSSPQPPAKKST
ncbi:hypothetical protein P3S67_016148 [Capsicum chacoense]